MSRLECRLLGPVEVWAADRQLELGPPRQRAVFAVLLSNLDRPTEIGELVTRVWAEPTPQTGTELVYGYVSALRRVLAGLPQIRVVRQHGGYRIQTDPSNVDLYQFRRLLAAAASGTVPVGDAERLLAQALVLWRGPAFGELAGPWLERQRVVLERERLGAALDLNDLQIRSGQPAAALPRLQELVATERLDERVAAQFMLATYHCGRPADALTFYLAFQRRLADELGADPGPELQAVHRTILRREPHPAGGPAARPAPGPAHPASTRPRSAGASRPAPAQLPAAVPSFVGRHRHLAQLDTLPPEADSIPADGIADPAAAATVVAVVSGTAGVGKTTLAVHWAHRVAHRFPDGQLYVNLRGFDPAGQIVESAVAVRGFLDALGVPADRIPTDSDAQAALYRTLLDDRRILVLLDNARDAEHVRPLLPGTRTAMTLITSRNLLTDLVAVDGAHPLTLDLLTPAEARQLLERRLGVARVAAEPEAVEQIINACARLPLALALVAARAAAHPTFELNALAGELAEAAGQPPPPEEAGHVITRVRAVFSWSAVTLTPAAGRVFRLLGLGSGPDISTAATASLSALPPPRTGALLAELTRAGLLTEHAPGRYRFHDLLAAYAADLARSVDTDEQRRAATVRLLDHYTHTAHRAARLLSPVRDPIPLPLTPPASGTTPEQPADQLAALGWLAVEHPVLMATQRLAADGGFHTHAWQLAWSLTRLLDRQGHWHDLTTAWQTALQVADRLTHPAAAAAHRELAQAAARIGDYDQADTHLCNALALHTEAGDRVGQADAHCGIAYICERRGRLDHALNHNCQALALFQAAGHSRGQAEALNAVGWSHAALGAPALAITYCEQALTLHRQLGDRFGAAVTWDSLGYAYHHLGRFAEAISCYQRAVPVLRDLGGRYPESDVLTHLGDAHHAAGETDAARTAWTRALSIVTDLGHPDADTLRTKLAALDQPAASNP